MSLRTWAGIVVLLFLVPPGTLAAMHLAGAESKRPLIRYTIVIGGSMWPTLTQGDGLVFARLPWHEGDIVMADVGERDPVIKRVGMVTEDWVFIDGDNRPKSMHYWVTPDQVMGKLLIQLWRIGGPEPPQPVRPMRRGRAGRPRT